MTAMFTTFSITVYGSKKSRQVTMQNTASLDMERVKCRHYYLLDELWLTQKYWGEYGEKQDYVHKN